MSLFACNSIETTQDLQHKGPGGMEAVGQPFFYNAETHVHTSKQISHPQRKTSKTTHWNLPKYFTDIGGVSYRGCSRDHAHLPHVRANAFSQHRLKHISVLNISAMKWKPAVSAPGDAAPTFNVLAAAVTTCVWGDSRQDMVAEKRRGRWPSPRELCKLDHNANSWLICHSNPECRWQLMTVLPGQVNVRFLHDREPRQQRLQVILTGQVVVKRLNAN